MTRTTRTDAPADKAPAVAAATEYMLWARPGADTDAMPEIARWCYEAYDRIIRNPVSLIAPSAMTLRDVAVSPETAAAVSTYLAASDPASLWAGYEQGVTHPLYLPTVSMHARRAVARADALCWTYLVEAVGCYGDNPEARRQQRVLFDLALTTTVKDDARLSAHLRQRVATGEYRWPAPGMAAAMKAAA